MVTKIYVSRHRKLEKNTDELKGLALIFNNRHNITSEGEKMAICDHPKLSSQTF